MSEAMMKPTEDHIRVELERQYRQVLTFNLSPQEIAAELNRTVVGQEDACRALAVHLRRHMLKVRERHYYHYMQREPWSTDDLGGVLLLGPTGCGKTYMVRALAQLASLVFHSEDASSLTETGYVGRDTSDIARAVALKAGGYPPLSSTALLFLDEVDKLRFRPDGNGKDVTGEGVQRSLLALLDGAEVRFASDGRQRNRDVALATNCLFVTLAGAFSGLEQIIARRLGQKRTTIGFGREPIDYEQAQRQSDLLQEVLPEDLVEYGFMPELVGRLRDIVALRPLSAETMRGILLHPERGPLAIHQRTAISEGFSLELTDELVDSIVASALASGQGARALKRILAQVTRRALFEMPGRACGRGETLVRLGLGALEDGSYEVITAPAGRNTLDMTWMFGAVEKWVHEREEMMPCGSTNDGDELFAPTTPQARDAASNQPATSPQAENDRPVPAGLEASAEAAAGLIAGQIRGDGYEVVYETELSMKGRQLGIHGMSSDLPTVRVTLWVANPEAPDIPPELSGRRLRAYAGQAGIEADGWCLRPGARAREVRMRPDRRRWRRHVVIIGLDYPEAKKYQ